MKRLNLLVVGMLMSSTVLFAGGLVTNLTQSAAWARTLSRNATLDIDGVYFNPAGLSFMDNGLHLSLSNQSIFQTHTITSNYPFLEGTPKSYEAELTAPISPSIYAAYKMDKWAFSAGFNIIGGGGSADFATGLPSFEIPVSSLVPLMQSMLGTLDQELIVAGAPDFGYRNVTGYNMNAAFQGSSNYFGIQVGATYSINEMISVAIGGRYVMAKTSYEGNLSDVTIDAPEVWGGTQAPGDYFLDKSAYYGNVNGSDEQINNETTIDDNAYPIHACLEYKFLGILGVSAGFTTGNLGVNDNYQSDLSLGLKTPV